MAVFLLDINVLLALAWPSHVHHQAAEEWFEDSAFDAWVGCSVTQCGFVRLSSNPKFTPDAVNPATALEALERMIAHPRHQFWEGISLAGSPHVPRTAIRGHNQVTDAYLLALVLHHGGTLVTFDHGILSLAHNDQAKSSIFHCPFQTICTIIPTQMRGYDGPMKPHKRKRRPPRPTDEGSYTCPTCGETIVIPLDPSAGTEQQYTEDCPVCCHPNEIHIEFFGPDEPPRLWAESE